MDLMRSCAALAIGMLALAGVANAQTPGSIDTDRGYVEGVIQSAFGNVTSQSIGAEIGVTIRPNLQVFVEAGQVHDVATAEIGTAAALMAGFLAQTQANVAYSVKEPVTFGVAGLKYIVPMTGPVRPYVLGGGGIASVQQNVVFTIGGSDVTSSLATQYGVQLGTDLSGSFTKPMFVVGGGAMWAPWQKLVVDLQFRFGRILADDGGINVSRAGLGVGVRF
jgi:opacity protein-like surface antigen